MKKIFAALIIICVVPLFAQKSRVGVLDFTAKQVSQAEAEIVADLFRSELVNSGKFDVLDRNNMDSILEEQEFQQSGCTDSECAVELGRMLNMQYMLYGSLMRLGEKYYVSVGMVDVESSKIVRTAKKKFESIGDADAAVRDVVAYLVGAKKEGQQTQVNMLKPIMLIGGIVVIAGGGGAQAYGYMQHQAADEAYDTYLAVEPDGDFTTPYGEYEKLNNMGNTMSIIGYSCYGVGAGLIIWSILMPDTVSTKTAAITPYISDKEAGLALRLAY